MPGGGTPLDGDAVGRRRLSSHAGQHRFESGTAAVLEHPLNAPQWRCTGRRVAVADTYVITVEASGEVTPAPPDDTETPDTDEVEQ